MSDELDHFLDDIYGKNVPPNAYASPEGRITKGDAKVYIADELRKARMQLKLNVFAQFKDVMMKQELSARPPEGIRFRTPLEELTIILEREVPLSELKGDTDE